MNNLAKAWIKARKGKTSKEYVLRFESRLFKISEIYKKN